MAYIGTKPTIGNFQICDAISVVNGQAAYTMQVGSVNVIPQSANHMIVSLNGTIQKPNSSFTVSGSTITFSSNLATGDVIDFIQILGDVLDLGVPSDATVTAAKLNNDIISGSTELASEPADTDEFLVSDAGTIKRIDYSLIKSVSGLSEVDYFSVNDLNINSFYDYTLTSSNVTRVSSSLNASCTFTKTGTGVSIDSDGLVSFPSTGTYYIYSTAFFSLLSGAESNYIVASIFGTNNGATGGLTNRAKASGAGTVASSSTNTVGSAVAAYFTVGDTSNDKVTFKYSTSNSSSNVRLSGVNTQEIRTGFLIMKVAG